MRKRRKEGEWREGRRKKRGGGTQGKKRDGRRPTEGSLQRRCVCLGRDWKQTSG